MSWTKIIGWLMFISSVLSSVADFLKSPHDFTFQAHFLQVAAAFNGLGFVAARTAIGKVEKLLTSFKLIF